MAILPMVVQYSNFGWWLDSQHLHSNIEKQLWTMGIFAFIGFAYELIQFAIAIGLIVIVVKCAS